MSRFCSISIETIWSCLEQVKNCPKIRGKYICQKWGTYGQNTWRWWLPKLKFCTEANQILVLKRLQNNFFGSRPLHGANISQIFSFTQTTEPHNIQLVPNIWDTSFHQPVKIFINSLADFASFQLVPKYKSKVKVISKYFILKQLFHWKMGAKGQISLMQIFNRDRPIVHWLRLCPRLWLTLPPEDIPHIIAKFTRATHYLGLWNLSQLRWAKMGQNWSTIRDFSAKQYTSF